jgi:hypothetical protein
MTKMAIVMILKESEDYPKGADSETTARGLR